MKLALVAVPIAALLFGGAGSTQDLIGKKSEQGTEIRSYDLKDVVERAPLGEELEPAERAKAAAASAARLGALRDFVRELVQPSLPASFDCQTLSTSTQSALVVLGTPAQQLWVRRFLAQHRVLAPYHVAISAQVLSVPEAAFASLVAPRLREGPRLLTAAGDDAVVIGTGTARDAFVKKITTTEGVKVAMAPRLLASPLSRATMLVGEEVAYVKDFEIQVTAAAAIADPVIATVRDGVWLEASAAIVHENLLGVALQFVESRLARPIPSFKTQLPIGGAKVEVQLPSVTIRKIAAHGEIPDGGTALLALPARQGHRLVVLLDAARVAAAK